jgi:ABC-type phosphate transport system permease subunit
MMASPAISKREVIVGVLYGVVITGLCSLFVGLADAVFMEEWTSTLITALFVGSQRQRKR